MASTEQLSLIRRDIKEWNSWRKKNSLTRVELNNSDLSKLDLARAALWDANLEGANLVGANLIKSDLRGANCKGANFSEANLSGADLRNGNFTQANLSRTILTQANLIGATLMQANLFDANLMEASLTAACIHNWLINQKTVLQQIDCNYVYFAANKLNRYPEKGDFKLGEFEQLVGKDSISETQINQEYTSVSLDVFDQLEMLNSQKIDQSNDIEATALIITYLIDEALTNIPESPTRHIKIAARVLNLLQNNAEFLEHFQKIKRDNQLDELEALIPNPAAKLIIIALKK
ncbi:pentapeptide repeat-containing protein [Gloeocapsa sp. PCC 73106]|uniref:pentapeptide repeat-containing protein n=1 Tax=Gloeocapsa sp. PCC 73106 TaxID=102232 RepID=UPI0002AC9C89|nr:pentapeptide repeat-containing protein [Gloeocapsa sp. PCC 73106]ELR97687.1 putative low-complexity protein [Gloeocapsa sp. PCC 73106]